jgi:hypothetical protein
MVAALRFVGDHSTTHPDMIPDGLEDLLEVFKIGHGFWLSKLCRIARDIEDRRFLPASTDLRNALSRSPFWDPAGYDKLLVKLGSHLNPLYTRLLVLSAQADMHWLASPSRQSILDQLAGIDPEPLAPEAAEIALRHVQYPIGNQVLGLIAWLARVAVFLKNGAPIPDDVYLDYFRTPGVKFVTDIVYPILTKHAVLAAIALNAGKWDDGFAQSLVAREFVYLRFYEFSTQSSDGKGSLRRYSGMQRTAL